MAAPQAEFGPWRQAGFPGAEQRLLDAREIYPRGEPNLGWQMHATVLFDQTTPWTQARAVSHIRRTAAILARCEIAFGTVRLVRLRLPAERRRVDAGAASEDTGVPPTVATLSALLPADTRYPLAFLVGRVDGTESLAVSYRAHPETVSPAPYLDTAWIGYPAHWIPRSDDEYSPLAHEFAHLLCRCGHVWSAGRHLLHSARNFLSSDVLPEHCDRFRNSPLVFPSN